jgi:hypothetical protein
MNMKNLIAFLVIMTFGLTSFAQAPQAFKYQAVARDASGNVLANKNVTFRISIIQGTVTGAIVYNELHSKTTNSFGLVDLEVGHGTSPSGDFSAIKWAVDQFFLKVEMDPAGGIAFQNMGTSQLLSVPYALYSRDVQNNNDADADPSNEIQDLSLSANTLKLSKSAPTVNLAPYFDNTDSQTLNLTGNNLGISGGNSVTLPGGDNWGSQTAVTDATLSGNGLTATPLKLNQQGAAVGQVLKWTGLTWQPGNDIGSLWSQNGTNVYYNGGNVGIGINAPAHLLTINGGTVASYASFINNNTGATTADGLVAGINTAKNSYLWNFEDGDIMLGTNNLERIRIVSEGKIGIGTSAPVGQLHIYANSSTSLAHLQLTENEFDYARLMFTNTSFAQKSWTIGGILGKLNTDSKIDFIYNDGLVAPKTVLSITGEGKVQHTRTGDTHMLPIAYGTVSSTGAILSGSGNFSVVYDATNKNYEITIDGETYSYSQFATLVTHIGSGTIGFPSVTSGTGILNVTFYMIDGTKKASYFSFLVYKP